MSKIKVENLKCFDEVANVIGVTNAKRELFIALRYYKVNQASCRIAINRNLSGSFVWSLTQQSHEFWSCVSRGENPYAN
jgi:hypothetical protein